MSSSSLPRTTASTPSTPMPPVRHSGRLRFLSSGVTTASPSSVHSTIGTQIGITGTPVIDLNGSPNPVLYLVAETNEGGSYIHRLHALDVTTGKDITNSPVKITGLNGFSSKEQLQRPALILANGNVYVSFGSEGDTTPWHGWIFGFETSNLTEKPRQSGTLHRAAMRAASGAEAAACQPTPTATSTPRRAMATLMDQPSTA